MDSINTIRDSPLNKIIGLSVVLLMGFLLVVLAGVYLNWFPIVDGLIFAVAHLPIPLLKAATGWGDYDFNFDPAAATHGNAVVELGRFVLAFLVVTGLYLPVVLYHLNTLTKTGMVLTVVGGLLIYGTVFTFTLYFEEPEDEMTDLGGGVI